MDLPGLNNTRDLGGMKGAGNKAVLPGKLIRSGTLHAASPESLAYLSSHVGMVVDFRTEKERTEKPDPVLPGVRYCLLPVFENPAAGIARDQESNEKAFAMIMQSPEMAREFMVRMYLGLVSNEGSVSQYRRFAHLLLEAQDKAILWHCTVGKDRAGLAAVFVQELLGIPKEEIVEDYLKTNAYVRADLQVVKDLAGDGMGERTEMAQEAAGWLFGARREYLDAVYRSVKEAYGGMDGFIREALGILDAERAELQRRYLGESLS